MFLVVIFSKIIPFDNSSDGTNDFNFSRDKYFFPENDCRIYLFVQIEFY